MLKLEDDRHYPIAPLPNAKDVKIERDLSGNDTLSFSYAMGVDTFAKLIKPQGFIVTPDQEYVIKEVNPGEENYMDVTAVVNIEDLKSSYINGFTREDVPLSELATNALTGMNWTFKTNVNKLRSLSMTDSTIYEILMKLADLYMCDIWFDAKNKVVTFDEYVTSGVSKGYFIDKLNLESLQVQNTTYDFCTRLIPVGKDELRITDVNAGLEYVENYQYTSQIIVAYWKADQYTDASALKEDAVKKLEFLSKPTLAYKAKVRDLANILPKDYGFMRYKLGDYIKIVDSSKQLIDVVRIVKTTDYPFDPESNEMELNSRYELLEDIESKNELTNDTVDDITTPDGGEVSGEKIDGVDWTKVKNVQIDTAQIKDLSVTTAKIQDATITTAKIGDLSVANAKIANATITDAKIHDLSADKITAGTIDARFIRVINLNADWINAGTINANLIGAKTITADKLAAHTITSNEIEVGTITAESGIIADAAIGTAQIQDLSVTGAKIATAAIDTVNIKAGAITTALIGTGAVDTAQIADGSITDAKIVSLTASKITAGTLDAGVINVINLNADNITVGTINGQHIADGAITGDKITPGAIDDTKIKDGASINGAKLNINTVFDEMNANQDIGYGDGGYGKSAYGGERHELNDSKIVITQEGKTLDLVLADVGDRISAAEVKITPDAIISTVINSTEFNTASSQVAQSAENIKIGFNGIDNNVVFDSDGLHVNHGSIDASLANITNINASNINTGILQGNLIAANTITGGKIVAGAITSREIATGTITANEIAGHTITSAELKTGTITASSGIIASIDASKITTGTLDGSDINTVNLQAQDLLVKYNGTQLINARPDINGGRIYIYNNDGDLNVTIGSSGFAPSNIGGTLILQDNNGNHKVEAGVATEDNSGAINAYGSSTSYVAGVYGAHDDKNGHDDPTLFTKMPAATSFLTPRYLYVGNQKVVDNGDLYHIGHGSVAYQTSISLGSNESTTINHNLGYYPIVQCDGNTGNRVINVYHNSTSQVTISNYSSGGNSWSGTVRLY